MQGKMMASVTPDPIRHGQESVWDYPRPALVQACTHHLVIRHRSVTLAETTRSVRTLETSHPPSYYIPRDDIVMAYLRPSPRRSICEWKGQAVYFDVIIAGDTFSNIAWSYPAPTATFMMLKDAIAFYAGPFEDCSVDGERVTPQAGGFYGGWITSHVAGPFKGGPGSNFW